MKNKTLRQVLAIVLVVMMLVPNLAFPITAEDGDVKVTLENIELAPGETKTVSVNVSGVTSDTYNQIALNLAYDYNNLEITAAKGSNYPTNTDSSKDYMGDANESGLLYVNIQTADSENDNPFNMSESGELLKLTIKAKEGAKAGTYYLTTPTLTGHTNNDAMTVGFDNESIDITGLGTITVKSAASTSKGSDTELETSIAQLNSNSKYYTTLKDALDEATATDTVTLVKSNEGDSARVSIPEGKTITLDLASYTYYGSITNNGTLTVTGALGGKLYSTLINNSIATIEGGTLDEINNGYDSDTNTAVAGSTAILTITDGVTGSIQQGATLEITGGSTGSITINTTDATTTISGGYINGVSTASSPIYPAVSEPTANYGELTITGGSFYFQSTSDSKSCVTDSLPTDSNNEPLYTLEQVGGNDGHWWQVLPKYGVSIKVDQTKNYAPGDGVQATIYVTGMEGKSLRDFDFGLTSYGNLTISSVTSAADVSSKGQLENSSAKTHTAFSVNAKDMPTISSNEFAIANVTFNIPAGDACGSATPSLENVIVSTTGTLVEYAASSVSASDDAKITWHAPHAVTINANDKTSLTKGLTLYAKYGDNKNLYTDVACTQVASDTITANAGYKFVENAKYGEGCNSYADLAKAANDSCKDNSYSDLTATPNVEAKKYILTATNDANGKYTFTNVSIGNTTLTADGDGTFTGEFTVNDTITFSVNMGNGGPISSVYYLIGNDSNTYSLWTAGATELPTSFAINASELIKDNTTDYGITLKAETSDYVKLTFKVSGEGSLFSDGTTTDVVRYVQYGGNGSTLFSDTNGTSASAPTLQESVNVNGQLYRARTADKDTYVWYSDEACTTGVTLGGASTFFQSDTTLYTSAIKQYTVTFAVNADEAAQASLTGANESGVVTKPYDEGTQLSTITNDMPTLTISNTAYEVTGWIWSDSTATTLTGNMTYTAQISKIKYTIDTTNINANVSITGEGVTNDDGVYTVEHGSVITITVSQKEGTVLQSVTVQNGEDNVELTQTGTSWSGNTTVTGAISISVITANTFTMSVVPDGLYGGIYNSEGTKLDNASFTVTEGAKISTDFTFAGNKVTYNGVTYVAQANKGSGYVFEKWVWQAESGDDVINGTSLMATFKQGAFDVYVNDEILETDAFTYTSENDSTVIYTLSKVVGNSDGTYTIRYVDSVYTGAGKDDGGTSTGNQNPYEIYGYQATGDLYFYVTEVKVSSLIIIPNSQYRAAPAGMDVAVMQVSDVTIEPTEGVAYTYTSDTNGEHAFFWSDKYAGYVAFVDAGVADKANIVANISRSDSATNKISYNGDVTLNNAVTSVDAGLVNDVLHGYVTNGLSDLQRFEMDVFNSAEAEGWTNQDNKVILTVNSKTVCPEVTVSDIKWILEEAVDLHTQSNAGGIN